MPVAAVATCRWQAIAGIRTLSGATVAHRNHRQVRCGGPHNGSGVVLTARTHLRFAFFVPAHAHRNRLAADLAIFDVMLVAARQIQRQRDPLPQYGQAISTKRSGSDMAVPWICRGE